MTESEASTSPPPHAVAPLANPSDVRNFLKMSRRLLDQGKPSQALGAVVMAMKLRGGEEAVSRGLNRAREMYMNKVQSSAAVEQLDSLFSAACVAESVPVPSTHTINNNRSIEPNPQGTSTSHRKSQVTSISRRIFRKHLLLYNSSQAEKTIRNKKQKRNAMNCRDTNMMEMVATSADPNDVRNLLRVARQLRDQGKLSQALGVVVMAIKLQGGEEALSRLLKRAREKYKKKVQASAAADQLASMFADCAIAEAVPNPETSDAANQLASLLAECAIVEGEAVPNPELVDTHDQKSDCSIEPNPLGTSILVETGRN